MIASLVVTAALAAAGAGEENEKPVAVAGDVEGGARFGVSAGNVLAAPFVLPGPGAFMSVSERTELFDVFDVGADASIALGINPVDSAAAPAGYKARLLVGFTLHHDEIVWRGDAHGGIASIALIPAPRVGLGTELAYSTLLVRGDWLYFDASGRFDADLVVIAPAPALSLRCGVHAKLGPVVLGARVGGDVDALVAILANAISASASVSLYAGAEL